jgi:hypothetical protein
LVVAKSVGREPVQHVGSVFRCCLAHRLVQDRDGRR